MPLQRNNFVPQNMLQVYTSFSGMTDLRTGLPYAAGGLMRGIYFDLTEPEAQAQGITLHSGRYRFVQLDTAALPANVGVGKIGCMKSYPLGVNFITDFSQNVGAVLCAATSSQKRARNKECSCKEAAMEQFQKWSSKGNRYEVRKLYRTGAG